jgi:tetratricopeptide (TPR) repeat protein
MQNVVAAVGALDDLNRLKGQVQRGEISDWDGQVGFGRAVCSRLDQAFELSQQPVLRTFEQVMQSRRDLATAFTAAFAELDRQLRTILGTTMQKLLARHDEVTVPPDVIQATVGVRPEVVPEYIDANPHSQAARVMFDADYIAKQIPNRPELAKKIPRYMTDFAYERAHPAEAGRFKPTVTQHLWISVDGMELAESPDKTTLETRAVRMRFNIRDKVEGRSVPGSASGYETLLTSIYDDLAVEFPVLHETREVVKIGAAADWIRARKPEFRLPAAGRTAWTGAARLPGLVYMTWTPNPRPGQVTASMMAMGGWEARRRAIERKIAELNVKIAWLAHAPGADPADVGRIAGLTAFPQPLGWVRRGTKDGVAVTALTIVPGRDEAGATVSRPGEDGGAIVWRIADLEGFEKETRARLAAAGADQRQAALQHALLAEALHEKGDDKAAIAELNEALRLAPDLPLIHLLRAKALAESGDVAGAKAALKQYLTLEPGNAAAAALLRDLDAPAAPGAGGQVRLGATFQQAKAMQLEGPRVSGAGMGTAPGFDTPTTVTPPLAPGFTMKGLARPLPPAVLQHPKMIELRREDARLEKEQQRVDQELQAVRVKKARREGDAKELEATETKLKQERQDLITKRDELETKMVDLGVQLEEEGKADTGAAPGAPADGVAPPVGAPSAPSTSPTAPSTSAPGPKR